MGSTSYPLVREHWAWRGERPRRRRRRKDGIIEPDTIPIVAELTGEQAKALWDLAKARGFTSSGQIAAVALAEFVRANRAVSPERPQPMLIEGRRLLTKQG